MNFSELQERLRGEILRRIDRGTLNGALLARQTGFRPSHISNFLRRRRTLSLQGLDRLLDAQTLSVGDLLPMEEAAGPSRKLLAASLTVIPVVTASAAIHEPVPHAGSVLDLLRLPPGMLDHVRSRRSTTRRSWSRFLAIRVTRQQSGGMAPALPPETLAVLDRHYNSPVAYHPPHPSIFAVRVGNALQLRLADFESNRLVLRPMELTHPVQLLALGPHEVPSDLIVGRVCLTVAPHS